MSIFSTYSTGENRVTASLLAVLRSLSLGRIERLLGAILEQSEFELVRFQNQPSKGAAGVPDAIIHASLRMLVETKTERNGLNEPQLRRHLKRLDEAKEQSQFLLVLTPDDERPKIIDAIHDQRMAWTSFALFDQAIDEMLSDPHEVVSERESFLRRELQNFFEAENLLASPNDVVIVAARQAWPEYEVFHAYVCQPNRPFQQVSRMGFYCKNRIYSLVPKILDIIDDVEIATGKYDGELGKLVDYLDKHSLRTDRDRYKVFLLSPPDSADTLKLSAPIPNNKRSKSDKPTAFTMGQRYVSTAQLLAAKMTSDFDLDSSVKHVDFFGSCAEALRRA